MTKRGWFVVTGVFVFALMLAACGSGDANEDGDDLGDDGVMDDVGPDNTAPSCGNGTCETGEGCSSCENDCRCTEEYTACREDACVDWDTINPLLKKLPGHWVRIEPPNSNTEADATVDPEDPDCHDAYAAQWTNFDLNPNEPGDACVLGFSPPMVLVLHGSSLRAQEPNGSPLHTSGQVLNDGTRVEFVVSEGNPETDMPNIYVKQ